MKTEIEHRFGTLRFQIKCKCDCGEYAKPFYHNSKDVLEWSCTHCGIKWKYCIRPPCECE